MKKKRIVCLLFSILACCFLTGCGNLLKNEQMDREVERLIAALNEDDADRIYQSLYPGIVTREEFDESYEAIRKIWEKSYTHTKKLNAINTKKTMGNTGNSNICEAQYYIYTPDKFYTINISYLSDDIGEGMGGFYLQPGAEPMQISGSFTTASENSVLQWVILIYATLSYLLIIITVVDILRKRPRLFGLWLVVVLAFFSFLLRKVPDNTYVSVGVNWFIMSSLKIYNNGSWILILAVPAGAVVYWCLRRRLLDRKAEKLNDSKKVP